MTQADEASSHPLPSPAGGFAAGDYGLYAAVVAIWGTSWLALHWQLGLVAPEVSLVWRFALAALVMLGWAVLTGARLSFPIGEHLRFLGLGVTIFSTNFLMFYYGGLTTPSGLLAVVFSLTSVFNILLSALVFGEKPTPRVVVAALLGFAGVALMFAPQIAGAPLGGAAMQGLAFCLAGTLFFCLGSILSVASQRAGVPIVSSTTWGMIYGVALLAAISLARGQPFILEPTAKYVLSLVWSAIVSSVLGFAAYLTLLRRIGSARAGYSTVMYPVVALAISTVFEGYAWHLPALAGLALVILGNLLMLRRR